MQLPHPVALASVRSACVRSLTENCRGLLSLGVVGILWLPALGAAVVTLHGVSDLPGGIMFSEVRDATKADGVIYAVGSSAAHADSTGGDTAILWSSNGGLQALPNLVQNDVALTFITASAITPDAAFIASRARSVTVGGARRAVRVTRSGLLNLNLGDVPGVSGNSAATAISADGAILYGLGNNNAQAYRFTAAGPTAMAIPFLNAGDTGSAPAARGSSADGSVMVGTSTGPTSKRAFRYLHGTGVSALPLLPGGTWCEALALSPDGNLAFLAGDSAQFPVGEAYLHDARNGAITRLGTPSEGWKLQNTAGLTADGGVVAVALYHPDPNGPGAVWFHNRHGWFQLHSAIAAGGLDFHAAGWSFESLSGLSADGTLAFGRATHNGNPEGFVLEFPPGYLAEFGSAPEVPANPTIVGAWTFGTAGTAIMFLPDGTYFEVQKATAEELANFGTHGLERGIYTWDPVTGALSLVTQIDTNSDLGTSGVNGAVGMTFKITGDSGTVHIPFGDPADLPLTRLKSQPGTITGGWRVDSAGHNEFTQVVIFLPDGTYLQAQVTESAAPVVASNRPNGIEEGTYTWNAATGSLVVHPTIDTNGEEGLSSITPAAKITLAPNQDAITFQDGPDSATAAAVNEVRLVATGDGTGLTLSWPDHLTDYSVQVTTTGPTAPNWQAVPGTPSVEGGMLRLRVVPGGTQHWFRLFKP